MKVKVYVEGGGETAVGQTELRIALGKLFERYVLRNGLPRRLPRFEPSGGREATVKCYKDGLRHRRNERPLVLVDSDHPIQESTSNWAFLESLRDPNTQEKYQWTRRPADARDDDLHFMVCCMESWLLADPDTIAKHYGHRFRVSSLPNPMHRNPESVGTDESIRAIKQGATGCPNADYDKLKDGPAILERIDPKLLEDRCPHARQFLEALTAALHDAASRRRSKR